VDRAWASPKAGLGKSTGVHAEQASNTARGTPADNRLLAGRPPVSLLFLDTGPWGPEVPGVPRALGLRRAQTNLGAESARENAPSWPGLSPQVGFTRLVEPIMRNSGRPEFRCHPRLPSASPKTWMPGSSPGMTNVELDDEKKLYRAPDRFAVSAASRYRRRCPRPARGQGRARASADAARAWSARVRAH